MADRRRYPCPLCGEFSGGTAKCLVKHCLHEMKNKVRYVCSNCGCKKAPEYKKELDSAKRHQCKRHGVPFTVTKNEVTLPELKTILCLTQGISEQVVDEVAQTTSSQPQSPKSGSTSRRRVG